MIRPEIVTEMKQDSRARTYALKEIAEWANKQDSEVKIPDLQRGLVWKPRQMELLWDSMLRGFPIGSFILSDATDGTFVYPEFHHVTHLGASLPDSPEGSFGFAQLSLKRTLDIYGMSYDLFSPLLRELCLTDRQMRRKRMMENLASKLDGSEFVFVARGGSLWRDYPVKRVADWTREWVSIGVRRKGKYFVSFAWGCNDQDHLEVGIRKLPGTDTLKDHSDLPTVDSSYWTGTGEWWYAEKGLSSYSEEEAILSELKKLNALFKDT